MKQIGMICSGLCMLLLVSGCSKPETGLGEHGLQPCPDRPNCVTSLNGGDTHSVSPILYLSGREAAREKIRKIVSEMERTRIITDQPGYLHVVFTSRVMRFKDDVEFWFPEKGNSIHIRSASRVGYSDLGVNRKRVEEIRNRFLRE
ncbi:MAG: DUF1499 domain-containing protein [Desulfobacterales bacterium]|nr:DUF1499 domain-containing protein [Desulfobacterales bacterium]